MAKSDWSKSTKVTAQGVWESWCGSHLKGMCVSTRSQACVEGDRQDEEWDYDKDSVGLQRLASCSGSMLSLLDRQWTWIDLMEWTGAPEGEKKQRKSVGPAKHPAEEFPRCQGRKGNRSRHPSTVGRLEGCWMKMPERVGDRSQVGLKTLPSGCDASPAGGLPQNPGFVSDRADEG